MENQHLDGAFISNKRVIEQTGYIKANIEIMQNALNNIESITEYDIWYPAWEKTKEGLRHMQTLIDKGMLR